MTASGDTLVYDSSRERQGLVQAIRNLVSHRELILVLTSRELASRYRRSFLGVLWTLLYPALMVAVLWAVFAHVFRVGSLHVPFVIYLFSGVIVFTLASQGITYIGASWISGESLVSRIYVPPEVFAAASGLTIGFQAVVMLVPLLLLQAVLGVGIPPTAVLAVPVLLLLLAFTVGCGMLVARLAVRVPDVLNVVGVLMLLLGYLTPTFYILGDLSQPYRTVVEANPLTQFLILLRDVAYQGSIGSGATWAISGGSAAVALLLGLRAYAVGGRHWLVAR
jgi:ABC-type polysaccharide/polyol phosphate export permease